MSTIAEQIRAAVLARLKQPTSVVPKASSIRRSHLIDLEREAAPYVYVIDGVDAPEDRRGQRSSSCPLRRLTAMVRIGVRSDAGAMAADDLLSSVLARLDPQVGAGYGVGIICTLGQVRASQEVADKDVQEIEIELEFVYPTQGGEFGL